MKAPCLNCEDRKLKCHVDCIKYKEFVDEGDAVKQAKLDYVMQHRQSFKHNKASINKIKNRK